MQHQNDLLESCTKSPPPKSSYVNHLLIGLTFAILATASYAFFLPSAKTETPDNIVLTIPAITNNIEHPILLSEPDSVSFTPPPKIATTDLQKSGTVWEEHKIKSGESLSVIFSKNKLSKSDLHKIVNANDLGVQFAKILPGKSLMIGFTTAGELSHLSYKKSISEELKATRLEDGSFDVSLALKDIERRINSATVTIHSSLFVDGIEAGLSNKLIMQLADIFAWDIDFSLDIRENDQLSILYETLYIEGNSIGTGSILAGEFINHGRSTKAVLYKDPTGKTSYFTPDGHSMRKAFIRSPIPFAHVSSRFNLKRRHPVLNRIRAHKGVDYAARTGTPIKASGDGKIIFRGRKSGYGNVVIIQHGQKYTTLYAHMSKFRRGQRSGSRVKQNDVIGYVGQTGLASGPHLHYEFRINGVHRNPLTVSLPNSNPIQKKFKADFLEKSKTLISQLDDLTSSQKVAQQAQ